MLLLRLQFWIAAALMWRNILLRRRNWQHSVQALSTSHLANQKCSCPQAFQCNSRGTLRPRRLLAPSWGHTAARAALKHQSTLTGQFLSFSTTSPQPLAMTPRCEETNDPTTDDDATRSASRSIMEGLNDAQIRAVTQPLSAITRVVAGPGSGKTRVLTCRIAYLLEKDPASRILAVTFTKKAAGEMDQRLEKLLAAQQQQQAESNSETAAAQDLSGAPPPRPVGLRRVTLGTFHSVCARILRWNGDLLATLPCVVSDMEGASNATVLDGSFAIADQGDQLRMLKECLKEANIDLSSQDLKIFTVLSALGKAKVELANGGDPFQRPKDRPLSKALKVVREIYSLYREKLLSSNTLDFDDLILCTRELLLHHEGVRNGIHNRWQHVLVDEFQDTSRSQMDLVKLLTSSSLLVVGDADQSIYSWRGAHASSLSDFDDEFRDYLGGVDTLYLMENYRSTSNIVSAAQKIISSSSFGEKQSPANQLRQDMKPKRGSGATPRIVACIDDKHEAEYVVKKTQEFVASERYSKDATVAFIYRTNAQSRALEEVCVAQNLPYVIFGSATSFYKRQEVKYCLCYLRWLYNGRDRGAMLRTMSTPKRGMGDMAVSQFESYCDAVQEHFETKNANKPAPTPLDILLFLSADTEGLDLPDPSKTLSKRPLSLLKEFSRQMRAVRDIASREPVEKVLASIIEVFQLIPHLDKISKSKAEFGERQANVQELLRAAARYTKDGPCLPPTGDAAAANADTDDEVSDDSPPLGRFLDDVALVTDVADETLARSGEDNSRFVVNLMTIHASKGMEFDNVFLVGCEEATIPTGQAIQQGPGSVELEEEQRLFYVAMTRAKTELTMSWRKRVPVFGKDGMRTESRKASRYLNVLSGEGGGSKGKKKSQPTPIGQSSVDGYGGPLDTANAFNAARVRRELMDRKKKKERTDQNKRFYYDNAYGPSGAESTPPPQKFQGTTSVYGRSQNRRTTTDASRHVAETSELVFQRAIQRAKETHSKNKRQTKTSSSGGKPLRRTRRGGKKSSSSFRGDDDDPSSSTMSEVMDSTWFFPVGTKVRHKMHGTGIVLPPRRGKTNGGDDGEMMLVRVKFEDGKKRDIPAEGQHLAPL